MATSQLKRWQAQYYSEASVATSQLKPWQAQYLTSKHGQWPPHSLVRAMHSTNKHSQLKLAMFAIEIVRLPRFEHRNLPCSTTNVVLNAHPL